MGVPWSIECLTPSILLYRTFIQINLFKYKQGTIYTKIETKTVQGGRTHQPFPRSCNCFEQYSWPRGANDIKYQSQTGSPVYCIMYTCEWGLARRGGDYILLLFTLDTFPSLKITYHLMTFQFEHRCWYISNCNPVSCLCLPKRHHGLGHVLLEHVIKSYPAMVALQ